MSTTETSGAGSTTTNGSNAVKILSRITEKLDSTNYMEWSELVLMNLQLFGLDNALDSDEPHPPIRSVLLLSMANEQRQACKSGVTAKEVWHIAKAKYGTPSRLMIADLKKQFYGDILQGSIQVFINTKRSLVARLLNAGQDVSTDLVDTILVGVRHAFESVVESLEDKPLLTIQELEERLLKAEESRNNPPTSQEISLHTKTVPSCAHCGKLGHVKEKCFQLRTCKRCNKRGHISRYCQSTAPQANTVLPLQNYPPTRRNRNDPIIDSGASTHMTGDRKDLHNYQPQTGSVQCANGSLQHITGQGETRFTTMVPHTARIIHVAGLKDPLYSVSQAVQGGKSMLFTESKCTLFDSVPDTTSLTSILEGRLTNGIYRMNTRNQKLSTAELPSQANHASIQTTQHIEPLAPKTRPSKSERPAARQQQQTCPKPSPQWNFPQFHLF